MDEMEKSVGTSEDSDRLSELPESLILHVLSFLPMRDVVSTTLLSKRWENLWTTLPCLNFSHIISEDDDLDSNRVRNFVNRALVSWNGTKLLKFIIDIWHDFHKSLTNDMDLWVRYAVQNKVEELYIHLAFDRDVLEWEHSLYSEEGVYRPPQCLNSCSSIRRLSLVGCNLRIHGSVAWNQLKSLSMGDFYFSEHMINRVLLGSPQLEVFELRLIDSHENLNISSTSLKKLKIHKYIFSFGHQPSLDTVLRICCPNLEMLEIGGVSYIKCLLKNVSSLIDVTLDDNGSADYGACGHKLLEETMRHLFFTFQHVERVALSSASFEVIGASQKKKLFSPLPNVMFLKVLGVHDLGLIEMVHLLEIFPNLKMLVIEDCTQGNSPDNINVETCLEFETNVSKSFLLHLKIIEIASNFSNFSIFRCIEFLLKHGCLLEKLVIRVNCGLESRKQARMLEVAESLLSMPRSSPTARIIFNKK